MASPGVYALVCELAGHADDVRALACGSLAAEGAGGPSPITIVSASRDKTVRVWCEQPGDENEPVRLTCVLVLAGHTDFVVGVSLKEDAQGGALVATASRDLTAGLWRAVPGAGGNLESTKLATLKGHQYQVTAAVFLSGAGMEGRVALATASLDAKIRVWDCDVLGGSAGAEQEPTQVLVGHEGPVLCLLDSGDGSLLSGSGDKTIRRWRSDAGSRTFACNQVIRGHGDTVRGLCALPGGRGFVSASHDLTLRCWSAEGGEGAILAGHSALVYDCDACEGPEGRVLVCSASEDETCRVWDASTGQCLQTVELASCAWSVRFAGPPAAAAGGGAPWLVTGTADGVVRLWGSDPDGSLAAHPHSLSLAAALGARLQERREAKASSSGGGGVPDGMNVEEPSALSTPGIKDGQVKMVKGEGGKAFAYQWNVVSCEWDCVGEVVAQPEGTGSGGTEVFAPGKTIAGEHYDFVFDVDIQDGVPPLKLGYNEGENPYEAADRFLLSNDLPMTYREQVVEFVIQNTGQAGQNFGAAPVGIHDNADPFTGNGGTSGGARPLRRLPVSAPLGFAGFQREPMVRKVRQLSAECASGSALQEPQVEALEGALQSAAGGMSAEEVAAALPALAGMLSWEKDKLFPAFDVARLVLLSPAGAAAFEGAETGAGLPLLIEAARKALEPPRTAACDLTLLRVAANACVHSPVAAQALAEMILPSMSDCAESKSKHVRLAWATFLLNCTVLWAQDKLEADRTVLLIHSFQAASAYFTALDTDAASRALAALGNLLVGAPPLTALAKDLGLEALLSRAKQVGGEIAEVAKDLTVLLS